MDTDAKSRNDHTVQALPSEVIRDELAARKARDALEFNQNDDKGMDRVPAKASFRDLLMVPFRAATDMNGEDGQARLRFLGSGLALVLFSFFHHLGFFGDLSGGVAGTAIYTAFGYVWCIAINRNLFDDRRRRMMGIAFDQAIFASALYFSDGTLTVLLFVSIAMSLGNGLRYGQRMCTFSSCVGFFSCGAAMLMSPYYQQHPNLSIGVLLCILLVPMYAVALNMKLQKVAAEAEKRAMVLEEVNRSDPLTGVANRVGLIRVLTRFIEGERCAAHRRAWRPGATA